MTKEQYEIERFVLRSALKEASGVMKLIAESNQVLAAIRLGAQDQYEKAQIALSYVPPVKENESTLPKEIK